MLKNRCFEPWCWRRLLRVPWTARRSNQSILKGNQSWTFIGRTGFEAETPILWPPDAKSGLIGKDPDAGKDWRQEKGTTEGEIVGWHHWCNGHEFEQALGVGHGTGKPGMLQHTRWQRVRQDWTTELNWGHYVSKISQTQKDKYYISLLCGIYNSQTHRHSAVIFFRGCRPTETGKCWLKGIKFDVCKWVSSGNLINSSIAVVSNIVL